MNFFREKNKKEGLITDGLKSFAANDYESAWRKFEQVLFIEEDNPVANTLGAASLLNLGRFEDAEPLARKGVSLTPKLALARYYLALLLIATERYDEAESEIWEAIAVEPENAGYRLVLGQLLFIHEREEEAREQLAKCLELSPEIAEAHFLLGLSLMRSGELRSAKDQVERALHLQPENDAALAVDGLLSMAKADDLMTTPPKLAGYRLAATNLRRALEINPGNELAAEWLRLAEETIERISKPSEPVRPEKWYKEFSKQLLLFVGMAMLSTGVFTLMVWLDETRTADIWVVMLCLVIFELLAFALMIYLRRDFSALPPTIMSFIERVADRELSSEEQRIKR